MALLPFGGKPFVTPFNIRNAPVSGTAGNPDVINTGDPNTKALQLKGTIYVPSTLPDFVNGGFETGWQATTFTNPVQDTAIATPWIWKLGETLNCVITKESSVIDTGLYSCKVVITSPSGSGVGAKLRQNLSTTIANGQVYSATARVKCDAASSIRLMIQSNLGGSGISSYHTGGGAWETLSCTWTVTGSPSSISVQVGQINHADVKVATYYVDTVVVYIGASTTTVLQTANLLETYDGYGALLSGIDASGRLVCAKSAGTPAGTPTNGTMVYDTTNNLLYVYNGGWKSVGLL